MPTRRKGEKKKDFISRYMGNKEAASSFPDPKQRYAVAISESKKILNPNFNVLPRMKKKKKEFMMRTDEAHTRFMDLETDHTSKVFLGDVILKFRPKAAGEGTHNTQYGGAQFVSGKQKAKQNSIQQSQRMNRNAEKETDNAGIVMNDPRKQLTLAQQKAQTEASEAALNNTIRQKKIRRDFYNAPNKNPFVGKVFC